MTRYLRYFRRHLCRVLVYGPGGDTERISRIYAPRTDRKVYVRFCDQSCSGKRAGRMFIFLSGMVNVIKLS